MRRRGLDQSQLGERIGVHQTWMRHASIASTALYTMVDDEQVAMAVALLPRPA
jgi:hypothetical protein